MRELTHAQIRILIAMYPGHEPLFLPGVREVAAELVKREVLASKPTFGEVPAFTPGKRFKYGRLVALALKHGRIDLGST